MKKCRQCEKETDEVYRCHHCGCYYPTEFLSPDNLRLVSRVRISTREDFELHLLRRIRKLEGKPDD